MTDSTNTSNAQLAIYLAAELTTRSRDVLYELRVLPQAVVITKAIDLALDHLWLAHVALRELEAAHELIRADGPPAS